MRRIVYLGGLIPADADSEHLVSRRDTGERLRAGRVPVTEIRAGIIVGPGSAAYEVIRDLVNHLPLMLTPRWVQSKSAPIALDNLLDYLVRVASIDEAAGKVLDAAGPDYLSYEQVMRQYGEVVGKRPRIMRVPVLTPTLSAYWLGLVTAVPANIARALIGGLKHDLPADDAELRRLVPQRLLSFRESVAAALQAEQTHTVAARWTEGLMMFRGFRLDNAFYAKRAGGHAVGPASAGGGVAHRDHDRRRQRLLHDELPVVDPRRDGLAGRWPRPDARPAPPDRTAPRRPHRLLDRAGAGTRASADAALRHARARLGRAGVRGRSRAGPRAPGQTRLTITAYWHPQGVWGLLYWYALVPAHLFIFRLMTRAMLRRAAPTERRRAIGLATHPSGAREELGHVLPSRARRSLARMRKV